jgi:hypothetical protein
MKDKGFSLVRFARAHRVRGGKLHWFFFILKFSINIYSLCGLCASARDKFLFLSPASLGPQSAQRKKNWNAGMLE